MRIVRDKVMYILYRCNREENDSEIIIPMVCSKDRSLLVRYLDDLLKESEAYDSLWAKYDEKCNLLIKERLERAPNTINWNSPSIVFPAVPRSPDPYLTREFFRIDEINCLDNT